MSRFVTSGFLIPRISSRTQRTTYRKIELREPCKFAVIQMLANIAIAE